MKFQESQDQRLTQLQPSQAAFHISSWAVWEPFTDAEYEDALVSAGARPIPDALGYTKGTTNIILPDDVMDRITRIIRIRAHEWAHFRQHISSQLGLFCHRLSGIKEFATHHFHESVSGTQSSYKRIPFVLHADSLKRRRSSLDEEGKKQLALLKLWEAADVLDGALWCKTLPVAQLVQAWDALVNEIQMLELRVFPVESEGCRLKSLRPPDSASCPNGSITVQCLVEGWARFREFTEVACLFSLDDAIKWARPEAGSVYTAAHSYLGKYIDVPFFHPLSGALLEVSVQSFTDPFLNEQRRELIWEEIHPGYAFMAAVQHLAGKLQAIPTSFEDAYAESLQAFEVTARQWPTTWETMRLRIEPTCTNLERV